MKESLGLRQEFAGVQTCSSLELAALPGLRQATPSALPQAVPAHMPLPVVPLAHPLFLLSTPPSTGQEAAQACEDAAEFGAALMESGICREALRRFELRRRARWTHAMQVCVGGGGR